MFKQPLALLSFALLLPFHCRGEETPKNDNPVDGSVMKDSPNSVGENSCKIYLAPSSIRGAGMGMFTTEAVQKGSVILPADGPSIPIIDPDYEKWSKDWVELFSSYWWGNGSSDASLFEALEAVEYQITMGALPNTHPYLDNVNFEFRTDIPYEDSLLDAAVDPGTGAFSYMTGRVTTADRDVEAGEELFLQYPEDLVMGQTGQSKFQDFVHAGKVVSYIVDKHTFLLEDDHKAKCEEVLKASQLDTGKRYGELARKLIPSTQDALKRIVQAAVSSTSPKDLSFAIAKEVSVERRTPEWIRENGICLENLVPGKSGIRQAGHGAIAQRFIGKGNIVVPAPTLQITNRDALKMFSLDDEYVGTQLLLNYCFGHDESSLLLCPSTNAILINHCSERNPDAHPCGTADNKPNAEYQWAKWDSSTVDWLNMTIPEMREHTGRGLSLDIVATRDIKEGEEVFIDYGVQWEEAWDLHVKTWVSTVTSDSEWKSIKELNGEQKPIKSAPDFSEFNLPTDTRGQQMTACVYWEDHEDFWDGKEENEDWEKMSMEEIVSTYGIDTGKEFYVEKTYPITDGLLWPCVVTTSDDNDHYTVRILQSHLFTDTLWTELDLPRIVKNFPRSSIHHVPMMYSSDLHSANTFRHHIGLKDDFFPEIWKDRMASATEI